MSTLANFDMPIHINGLDQLETTLNALSGCIKKVRSLERELAKACKSITLELDEAHIMEVNNMSNKEMTDVMEDIFTRLSDEAKRGSCTPQELTDLARAMLAIYEAIVYGR